MNFIKPPKLRFGDTVAIVSPSWGGPSLFPHVYHKGIEYLKNLGLKIKEYPTAQASADYLNSHPESRAKDLNDAFANAEVKAIISTIGGDDSVRLLPFLNYKVAIKNPKILMGFSDTAICTTFYNRAGLVTFNGPSIMAGFSQAGCLGGQYQQHLKNFLFGDIDFKNYVYQPYSFYVDGYPNWKNVEDTGKTKEQKPVDGWHWLQGNGLIAGELFGGCIEVLEFIKSTSYWPSPDFWEGKIFFLETSEDKPSINQIQYFLRNYGIQGIFDKISALIFGRARDYSVREKQQLDDVILNVVRGEFGNKNLTLVTNMDFGHTDPQLILPLGIKSSLNYQTKRFGLLESPFQD